MMCVASTIVSWPNSTWDYYCPTNRYEGTVNRSAKVKRSSKKKRDIGAGFEFLVTLWILIFSCSQLVLAVSRQEGLTSIDKVRANIFVNCVLQ